jgi:TPR repeat protein
MKGLFIFPVLLIVLFGTPVFADWQKGRGAYKSGDYATALKEWEPLAEQGNADAQAMLGAMYIVGQGVTQDYKVGFQWSKLAAEQGSAGAQGVLGALYVNGQGVTVDHKAAYEWFKKAAEQGFAEAQSALSYMYAGGFGVSQDYNRAHMWREIAASQGYEDAATKRDKVQENMTPYQIEKVRELARDCVAKNYKGC